MAAIRRATISGHDVPLVSGKKCASTAVMAKLYLSVLGATKEYATCISGGMPCGSGPGSTKDTAKELPTWSVGEPHSIVAYNYARESMRVVWMAKVSHVLPGVIAIGR